MTDRPDYPTRVDIQTALTALQEQLDVRFQSVDQRFEAKRALIQSEMGERDKAVVVLEAHLREHVRVGDENLKQHVDAQKESVRIALESLNQLMNEREKAINVLDTSRKESRDRADSELRDKLHEMNKFRDQITLERSTFVSRDRHEGDLKQVISISDRNRDDMIHLRSEIVGKDTYSTAVEEWNKWRAHIDKILNTTEGRDRGFRLTGGALVATIGTIVSIIMIVGSIFTATVWLGQPRPTANTGEIKQQTEMIKALSDKVSTPDPQIEINTANIARDRENITKILDKVNQISSDQVKQP